MNAAPRRATASPLQARPPQSAAATGAAAETK